MSRRPRPASGGSAGDAFGAVGAPVAAPPTAVDPDDGFLSGGTLPPPPASGAVTESVIALTSVGPRLRPNGEKYRPRMIGPHEDLAWLRACRDAGEHTLFVGPPGTGKTALAEAAFAPDAVDGTHPGFESLVCTGDTAEADFTGTWVQNPVTGAFVWAPGPLHLAVLYDVPLYVDEIFLTPPQPHRRCCPCCTR